MKTYHFAINSTDTLYEGLCVLSEIFCQRHKESICFTGSLRCSGLLQLSFPVKLPEVMDRFNAIYQNSSDIFHRNRKKSLKFIRSHKKHQMVKIILAKKSKADGTPLPGRLQTISKTMCPWHKSI